MIRHIVMFTIKEYAEGKTKEENLQEILSRLQGFENQIPVLRKFDVVINDQKADQSNYDFALICDFDNLEDLDRYQTHPVHKEFGAFLVKVKENRACIDYVI